MVQVTLTVTSVEGTRQVPLAGDALTIGRTDASALVIGSDGGLSRVHATVRRRGEGVWLFDERSTNGSYLNGEPVPPDGARLSDGDEISIGNHTTIRVRLEEHADEAQGASASAVRPLPEPQSASVLKYAIPGVAVALLLLMTIALGLYKLKGAPSRDGKAQLAEGRVAESNLPLAEPAPSLAASEKIIDDSAPVPGQQGSSNLPGASSSGPSPSSRDNASKPAASAPLPAELPAASGLPAMSDNHGARPRLYKEMTEEEQKEFIQRRAQHIAIMMGKRPYAFTPDALTHIKFWLDSFSRRAGNRRTGLWGGDTVAILERGKGHAPVIIQAFEEHHVPVVVGLYIPFIETEYNNISSNNSAGAAGLFQFLGATAEGYGVPSSERTNVPRMAEAAAKYFRDNIMNFGNDSMSVALSIAGYNRNPESVKRDLRNVLNLKNNEDKERTFWTLIANKDVLDEKFQKENSGYVPRFFAAAIFGETPWAFGIEMRALSTYRQFPGPSAVNSATAPAASSSSTSSTRQP